MTQISMSSKTMGRRRKLLRSRLAFYSVSLTMIGLFLKVCNETIAYDQTIPAFTLPEYGVYPVHGTQLSIEDERGETAISAVYALPEREESKVKGVAVLLHACTHNAFKFFSPSEHCPDCVGLSEELKLTRGVLKRGYIAIAVTSKNRKNGCWGGDNDSKRIQQAMENVLKRHSVSSINVIAIGASSGGSMAAKLVADKVASSALVMVMGLRNELLDKLLGLKQETSLYLAPMTRDKGTAKRDRENARYLSEHNGMVRFELDEISCLPKQVTPDYLWSSVPGMTREASRRIVDILVEHRHLDPQSKNLLVDPTKSNWRDLVMEHNDAVPDSVHLVDKSYTRRQNTTSTMTLWEVYDLTPGMSPLAKALHRAWAFHEYCSEALDPAMDFFERKMKRVRNETLKASIN